MASSDSNPNRRQQNDNCFATCSSCPPPHLLYNPFHCKRYVQLFPNRLQQICNALLSSSRPRHIRACQSEPGSRLAGRVIERGGRRAEVSNQTAKQHLPAAWSRRHPYLITSHPPIPPHLLAFPYICSRRARSRDPYSHPRHGRRQRHGRVADFKATNTAPYYRERRPNPLSSATSRLQWRKRACTTCSPRRTSTMR